MIGKCHSQVYAVEKASPLSALKYISSGFPNILKKYRAYILASFGFFFAGLLLSLLLVLASSSNASYFLDPAFIEAVESNRIGGGYWNNPLEASSFMTNNILVSIKAFVYGITLGVGTIYILFFNGALLGALTALVYLYSDPVKYWSLILPHGVIELTAIFIAGAAGLMIGRSLLIPKEHSRLHSLVKGSKSALSMIWGIILMLIVAGIIEGFFTPSKVSQIGKLIFAATTGILLIAYLAIPYIRKTTNVDNPS